MNTEQIKSALRSQKVTYFMIALLITAVLILIFRAGQEFGYRQEPHGPPHHGAIGKILDIHDSQIRIANKEGLEKNIITSTSTIIRRQQETVPLSELHPGNIIVVLGTPEKEGAIRAKIIRILPPPTEPSH